LSRGRPGPRGAAAGIALAAAGMIYSRLTGRRPGDQAAVAAEAAPDPEPSGLGEPPLGEENAPSEAVERARSELADELARRAGRREA
jgi:hypothetical protein